MTATAGRENTITMLVGAALVTTVWFLVPESALLLVFALWPLLAFAMIFPWTLQPRNVRRWRWAGMGQILLWSWLAGAVIVTLRLATG
jgi:hypothetical protein